MAQINTDLENSLADYRPLQFTINGHSNSFFYSLVSTLLYRIKFNF